MKNIFLLFSVFILISCVRDKENKLREVVQKWEHKEILFPTHSVYTKLGRDTVNSPNFLSNYKVLTYVDSIGCTSCKLQLVRWREFIRELDSLEQEVPVLFYLHPKKISEITLKLRQERFDYPVCIDEQDSLNKLNHFPTEMNFQTFLLDRDNKVVAIGNPIHNPKIKELYLDVILGRENVAATANKGMTQASFDKKTIELGTFDWHRPQTVEFVMTNTGKEPLQIEGVTTSCDCVTATCSKETVPAGNKTTIKVTYTAEKPEPFYRTITVYCNTPDSPIELEISGEAVELATD